MKVKNLKSGIVYDVTKTSGAVTKIVNCKTGAEIPLDTQTGRRIVKRAVRFVEVAS